MVRVSAGFTGTPISDSVGIHFVNVLKRELCDWRPEAAHCVFAEFERAMIRERVKAGLERARAQGKALGRPRISTSTDAAIRKALKNGDVGIRKLAATLGVGTGTVQRIKAEMSSRNTL